MLLFANALLQLTQYYLLLKDVFYTKYYKYFKINAALKDFFLKAARDLQKMAADPCTRHSKAGFPKGEGWVKILKMQRRTYTIYSGVADKSKNKDLGV